MRPLSRRQALQLMGGSALGAALVACGASRPPPSAPAPPTERALEGERVAPSPSPAPTPRPVPPRGREERALLPGTEWAMPLVITHSGVEGARVMVLGGVHGNEPGGWLAAEEIAGWEPSTGSLLVVPRANVLATRALVRTLPELGDLNRLSPGAAASELPMARMAAAITSAAREFEVDLLLDLHESWGFYAERTQNGTAFLGQTVSKGRGPIELDEVRAIADAVNERTTPREQLIVRDRFSFRWRGPARELIDPLALYELSALGFRGSSSLSLGGHVEGLTPVLVEMGQERQPEARRAELHRLLVRAALDQHGMLTPPGSDVALPRPVPMA